MMSVHIASKRRLRTNDSPGILRRANGLSIVPGRQFSGSMSNPTAVVVDRAADMRRLSTYNYVQSYSRVKPPL